MNSVPKEGNMKFSVCSKNYNFQALFEGKTDYNTNIESYVWILQYGCLQRVFSISPDSDSNRFVLTGNPHLITQNGARISIVK